jgi:inhibitor of KinA sporulation pathway (predicted exonuclease)
MKYIIFDLEFNTDFKIDRTTRQLIKGNANPLCPQEIIEIGAVKTDSNIEIEDTFQTFVKPQLYKKLHPKVKKKTKITASDLSGGLLLKDSVKLFKEWLGEEEFIMCSWGKDDINELKRNCDFFSIPTHWIEKYCDVQKLCAEHLKPPKGNQIGLKAAVEAFNIDIDHVFHKALNDSIYTAKILKKLVD